MGQVFLFIVITIQGQHPQPFKMEMENADACAAAVHELMTRPPAAVVEMPEGGSMQVTCAVMIEPSKPL